jgi:hypothetical protein
VLLYYMVLLVVLYSDLTDSFKCYIVQQYQYAHVTSGNGVVRQGNYLTKTSASDFVLCMIAGTSCTSRGRYLPSHLESRRRRPNTLPFLYS